MPFYGGIEAGGTKFVCIVAASPQEIVEEVRFPTTSPQETLGRSLDFFSRHARRLDLVSIGVAAFGPVDLDSASSTFGYITTTPKPGWAFTDVVGALQSGLRLPVAFDTDVNGAAFGEYTWIPANHDKDPLLYMTVGTGIGVGGIFNGSLMHGLVHPEMGHMRIPHDTGVDPFPGTCPYHGDCFEGLASGPAMLQRWGQPAESLPPDHPGWDLEAHYIALAVMNLVCCLSPRRIVLGGGVMQKEGLILQVRHHVQVLLNGYIRSPAVLEDIEGYLVLPGLGHRSGVMGAVALAIALAKEKA